MTTPPDPRTEHSVIEMLERVQDPDQLDRELVLLIVDSAGQRDPALADALRLCAIPRRFDAEVLFALRDDDGQNGRLLNDVTMHSFVRASPDGGFAYDDVTRAALLDEWRTPDRVEEFEQRSDALVTLYLEHHERAKRDELELRRIADVVRRASPERYMRILRRVESGLLAPLLEALYQASLVSPENGYELFEQLCFEYEAKGWIETCRTLLRSMNASVPESLADGQHPVSRWLRYWEGRLARDLRQEAESERMMEELLAEREVEPKLQLWVLDELSKTQHLQNKLREALETRLREVALSESAEVDPYNLPVSYISLGELYNLLEEPGEAELAYRRAIDLARANEDSNRALAGLLGLAGVLRSAGRGDEAMSTCLEALEIARVDLPHDVSAQQSVAWTLAAALAMHDPMAADAAFDEAEELSRVADDPLAGLGLRVDWVEALLEAGQLDRAVEHFALISNSEMGHIDERFRSSILLTEARLMEAQGRLQRALELNDVLLARFEQGLATTWDEAAAHTNRGNVLSDLGRWDEAESAHRTAESRWRSNRHDVMADVSLVNLANVVRRRGALDEARELLRDAKPLLDVAYPLRAAYYYRTRGATFALEGRFSAAADDYRRALGLHHAVDSREEAADVLVKLASLADDQSHWREAALNAAEAARLWGQLADLNEYDPSGDAKTAARENATGMRVYVESDGDLDRIAWARDLFRTAAERVPHNPWYQLNLAYAHALLSQPDEGCEAIEAALEAGIGVFPSSYFYELLGRLRLMQAELMVREGTLESAADVYAIVHDRLAGLVSEYVVGLALLGAGDVRLLQGRHEDAANRYGMIDRFAGAVDWGSLLLRESLLAALAGDHDRADEALRLAVELRDGDDEHQTRSGLRDEADGLVDAARDDGELAHAVDELSWD